MKYRIHNKTKIILWIMEFYEIFFKLIVIRMTYV